MNTTVKNRTNLDKLFKIFEKSVQELPSDRTIFVPFLSPTKPTRHRNQLRKLAKNLINIEIIQHNTKVFQRSKFDINGSDFIYITKLSSGTNSPLHMIDPKTRKFISQEIIVERFLRRNKLEGISNIPIPESQLPKRIRDKFDRLTLLSILGLLITNDPKNSSIIIKNHLLSLK